VAPLFTISATAGPGFGYETRKPKLGKTARGSAYEHPLVVPQAGHTKQEPARCMTLPH
jgi:hypothetical protein